MLRQLIAAIFSVAQELNRLREHQQQTTAKLMTAIETLTTATTDPTSATTELADAVNAAVVSIGSPTVTDAQLNAITAVVAHNTEVVKSQSTALREALATESATPVENPPVQ